MTSAQFRRLALSLPQAEPSAHMNHPDFRVGGKVFATLGYPAEGWGMVKLTPVQQELYLSIEPDVFVPARGAWGLQGATCVRLGGARTALVRDALAAAWDNVAPKEIPRPKPRARGRKTARRPGPAR